MGNAESTPPPQVLSSLGPVRVTTGRCARPPLSSNPALVGLRLDDDYGIMCRVGLHCSPAAHKTIGTFPRGTVRFGLGIFNTVEEVDAALAAVRALAEEAR